MFDSLKEISLRTIALVAVAVWAILAAVWFLALGWDNTIPAPAPRSGQETSGPLTAAPLSNSTAPAEGPDASPQASPEIVIQGGSAQEAPAKSQQAATPRSRLARPGELVLQLGAFKSEQGAQKRASEIRSKGIACQISSPETAGDYYRVLAGPYDSKSEALSDQVRLKEAGIDSFLRKAF